MKQQQVWFACDAKDCDATSSPETTAKAAREMAKSEGWKFENLRGGQTPQGAFHWCPLHRHGPLSSDDPSGAVDE